MKNILKKLVEAKKEQIKTLKIKTTPKKANSRFLKKLESSKLKPTLIAEIKLASPSAGSIAKASSIPKFIKAYNKYACAISFLMEEKYFKGGEKYFYKAKKLSSLPFLYKDFVIDKKQINHALALGFEAILLIVKLSEFIGLEEFKNLYLYSQRYELPSLVEIYDEADLNVLKKIQITPSIIGINSRNLKNFSIDLKNQKKLALKVKKLFPQAIIVAESGIKSKQDLEFTKDFANSVLIGTYFMKSKNPEEKIKSLYGLI